MIGKIHGVFFTNDRLMVYPCWRVYHLFSVCLTSFPNDPMIQWATWQRSHVSPRMGSRMAGMTQLFGFGGAAAAFLVGGAISYHWLVIYY